MSASVSFLHISYPPVSSVSIGLPRPQGANVILERLLILNVKLQIRGKENIVFFLVGIPNRMQHRLRKRYNKDTRHHALTSLFFSLKEKYIRLQGVARWL